MITITFGLAKRLTGSGFFERRRAMKELRELVALNYFVDCRCEGLAVSFPPGEYTIDNQGTKTSFTVPEPGSPALNEVRK